MKQEANGEWNIFCRKYPLLYENIPAIFSYSANVTPKQYFKIKNYI
jgi:hypothetical protein